MTYKGAEGENIVGLTNEEWHRLPEEGHVLLHPVEDAAIVEVVFKAYLLPGAQATQGQQ